MSLTDALAGIAVTVVFVVSLSALVSPLMGSLGRSRTLYERAKAIEFLDRSFRTACSSGDGDFVGNVERWKRDAASVCDLASCDVIACRSGGTVRAMRAKCVIGDVHFELLAEYGHE